MRPVWTTRTPRDTDVVKRVRALRLVIVSVRLFSRSRSAEHSSRMSVGLRTWKRAGPSVMLPVRDAAPAGAAISRPASSATGASAATRAMAPS